MTAPARPRNPARRWRVSVTPTGWVVIAAVIVGDAVGAALGYGQLLVVSAAGLIALVAAAVLVLWRPRVTLERSFHPVKVVAGEAAVAVLAVTNESRWRSPPLSAVDRLGREDVPLPVHSLGPGRTAMLHYSLPTERRARLTLGPLAIVRTDPLALLQSRQHRDAEDVLWVHSRTWPMAPLPTGIVVDLEGPVSETAQAGSVTFSSLREYVPGDDRRLIHWRSSARTGTLLVRHHVDTNEPTATIVLDARQPMWTAASFEDGIEVCASVAAAVGAGGQSAELRIVGESPGRMRDLGAVTLADCLSAAEPTGETHATALLRTIEAGAPGGALVVVTGRLEPELEARLAAERRRYSPVVVCRIEPAGVGAGAGAAQARAGPAQARGAGAGAADGRDGAVERGSGWRARSGVVVVYAPTAPALARAWNRMVHA